MFRDDFAGEYLHSFYYREPEGVRRQAGLRDRRRQQRLRHRERRLRHLRPHGDGGALDAGHPAEADVRPALHRHHPQDPAAVDSVLRAPARHRRAGLDRAWRPHQARLPAAQQGAAARHLERDHRQRHRLQPRAREAGDRADRGPAHPLQRRHVRDVRRPDRRHRLQGPSALSARRPDRWRSGEQPPRPLQAHRSAGLAGAST